MKSYILVIMALFVGTNAVAQPHTDAMWDRANTAYVNADFATAIAVYDSISESGYVSQKLFYNLGSAYFKEGWIGKAILNYNRALLLDPSDSDVRHNLKVVNAYVKDKIEAVPVFFLSTWIHTWRSTLGSDAWAVVSLVMLTLALTFVMLYLLSRRTSLRKTGFYGAILSLVIMLFATIFAVVEKNEMVYSDEAIIMISAAPVKSSPDNASKDIFILHEGTKVKVVSSLAEWREIVIADGNKGWILQSSIEDIRLSEQGN